MIQVLVRAGAALIESRAGFFAVGIAIATLVWLVARPAADDERRLPPGRDDLVRPAPTVGGERPRPGGSL